MATPEIDNLPAALHLLWSKACSRVSGLRKHSTIHRDISSGDTGEEKQTSRDISFPQLQPLKPFIFKARRTDYRSCKDQKVGGQSFLRDFGKHF